MPETTANQDDQTVWLQLFQHKGGGVLEAVGESHPVVLSSKSLLAGLKDAVKAVWGDRVQCIAPELQVYKPGSVTPTSTDPKALRIEPGTDVKFLTDAEALWGDLLLGSDEFPRTTYSKPIVVTAPALALQQQQGVAYTTQKLLDLKRIEISNMSEPQLVTGWRREEGKTVVKAIYLRSHLVEKKRKIDQFLADTQKMRLYVCGPPGSGKTCFFLAYFTQWARKNKKCGLVVQYRRSISCDIIILNGDKDPEYVVSKIAHAGEMRSLLSTVISSVEASFCIFDGVRQNIPECGDLLAQINHLFLGKKVVHITSLQFNIKGGDGTKGKDGGDSEMDIDSWQEEDYKASHRFGLMTNDDWFEVLLQKEEAATGDRMDTEEDGTGDNDASNMTDTEMILELIERKFYYCGGSARFFFDYVMDALLVELDALARRIEGHSWKRFACLQITDKLDSSVSSVLQRLKGGVFPVSEYFMLLAYERCKEALVNALKTAADAADNPVMKGWAFELEQLHIVLGVDGWVSNEDESLVIPVERAVVVYDGTGLKGDTKRSTFIIECSKWNQGCFDVAFVIDETLVTVNFTIASSQSLKASFIGALKVTLEAAGKKIKKVAHLAILDNQDTFKSFKFSEATGVGFSGGTFLYNIEARRAMKLVAAQNPIPGARAKSAGNCAVLLGEKLKDVKVCSNRSSDRKRQKPAE